MQQALAGLNARWRAQGRPELQIHVGLNTGRVAAGNIGSEQYLQYATIGDATNVGQPGLQRGAGWRDLPGRDHVPAHPGADLAAGEAVPRPGEGKEGTLTLYRVDWQARPVR